MPNDEPRCTVRLIGFELDRPTGGVRAVLAVANGCTVHIIRRIVDTGEDGGDGLELLG